MTSGHANAGDILVVFAFGCVNTDQGPFGFPLQHETVSTLLQDQTNPSVLTLSLTESFSLGTDA